MTNVTMREKRAMGSLSITYSVKLDTTEGLRAEQIQVSLGTDPHPSMALTIPSPLCNRPSAAAWRCHCKFKTF